MVNAKTKKLNQHFIIGILLVVLPIFIFFIAPIGLFGDTLYYQWSRLCGELTGGAYNFACADMPLTILILIVLIITGAALALRSYSKLGHKISFR